MKKGQIELLRGVKGNLPQFLYICPTSFYTQLNIKLDYYLSSYQAKTLSSEQGKGE